MSGSGLNHNQNHLIQNNRSTSRVLQPPGGASSFSIGGGNFGDDSRGSYGNRAPLKQKSSEPDDNYSRSNNSGSSNRRSRSDSNDSLDRLMNSRERNDDASCRIPGLENHYRNNSESKSSSASDPAPSYVSAPSRFNGRSSNPMGQQEYAAQLKAQIDFKKTLDREDGVGGSSYRNNRESSATEIENRRNGSGSSSSSSNSSGSGKYGSKPPPLPLGGVGGGGGSGRDGGRGSGGGGSGFGSRNSSSSNLSRSDPYGDNLGGGGGSGSRGRGGGGGGGGGGGVMLNEDKGIAGLKGRVKQNPGGNSSINLGWS